MVYNITPCINQKSFLKFYIPTLKDIQNDQVILVAQEEKGSKSSIYNYNYIGL